MKGIVKILNHFLISLILVVVYALIIGLSSLIFRLEKLIHRREEEGQTYWIKAKEIEYSARYFESAL